MNQLSHKSVIILEMIARGHTYDDILRLHPQYTTMDIAIAAREILDHAHDQGVTMRKQPERFAEMRQSYPRAYVGWTDAEERELLDLYDSHTPVKDIALKLARRPSAVAQRLRKLRRNLDVGE
ncbi:MAG: hypothetical protein KC519_07095 [Anaerolineae bacterium]|nr:hypothetical protein [Anaerolineae bacterium]